MAIDEQSLVDAAPALQLLPVGDTAWTVEFGKRIDPALHVVPEISGHRLMVAIRLMRADAEGRLKPCGEDASFELTLCA